MKQVSGRDLAQIIQRCGWILARVHGSHHVFTMAGRRERIVIPIHGKSAIEEGIASLADEDCGTAKGRYLSAKCEIKKALSER